MPHVPSRSGCSDTAAEPIRTIHDVLSNRCRRAILYHLQDRDEPTSVSSLVRRLAAGQYGPETTAERESVLARWTQSQVYRTHIKQLTQFGILEYDPEAETVWIPDGVAISVSAPRDSNGDRTEQQSSKPTATRPRQLSPLAADAADSSHRRD